MQIKSVIVLYSNSQIQEALNGVEILTKDYPDEPLLYNFSGAVIKQSTNWMPPLRALRKHSL